MIRSLSPKMKRVWRTVIIVALVAMIGLSVVLVAGAEKVTVYTHTNPTLTMLNIYGEGSPGWPSNGAITQEGSKYTLTTNAWAFWEQIDSLDFAYEKTAFNTGRGSVLTAEVTIQSWDGGKHTAQASTGIHMRNSLAPDSSGVFLCVRDGIIYLMYRKTDGATVQRGLQVAHSNSYPISLRLVANKSMNNAAGYYRVGDGKWINIGNVSFQSKNEIYTGLAAHLSTSVGMGTSVFENFNITLEAPEGYVIEDDGDTPTEGTEAQVILPEDLPTHGDALLSETFTDGDMFPTDREKIGVANPVWTVRSGAPNVVLNADQTNRYLKFTTLDNEMLMTAGDMTWTDYSASLEFRYNSDEMQKYEKNQLSLLLRHRDVVIGGNYDYAVTLVNKIEKNELVGQFLQFNYRTNQRNFISAYTVLAEVQIAQGDMIAANVTHTLKVDALDNTFKIYLDGQCLIEYVHEQVNDKGEVTPINLIGNIGLYTNSLTADVDNILVRKLNDPLGGDYDNSIGGRFDEPVPDYIVDVFGKG